MLQSSGIQKRTTLALLGATGLAFVIAVLVMLVFQSLSFDSRVRQTLEPYAKMVAVSAQVAVDFQDAGRAAQLLGSLKSNPNILRADIILSDGTTLATYSAGQAGQPIAKSVTAQPDGVYFENDAAYLLQSLSPAEKGRAHLIMRMSLDQLRQRNRHELIVTGLTGFFILLAITATQLYLLRKTVLDPVARLATAAEQARKNSDYTQRVPVQGDDELAVLGKSFNSLLATVEYREAALRKLTNFQNAILNNAAYAIISTDPAGLITSFNPAAERLLGYPASAMIGRQTPVAFHDAEEVAVRARQLTEQLGEPVAPGFETFVALARRNLPSESEWTYLRSDGRRVPVQLSVTAMHDEHGEIAGFLGMATNITERRQGEAKLRETLEFDQQLITASLIGIEVFSADGRCVLANAAAAQYLGATIEQLLAQNFWQLTSLKQAGLLATAENVLSTGSPEQFEVHLTTSFGRDVWLECIFSRFNSGGKPHLLTLLSDTSQRRQAEESLRESQRLYEELVSTVPLGVYRVVIPEENVYQLEYVSDRFCEVTGLQREAVMTDASLIFGMIHPEDLAEFKQLNQEAFRQRGSFLWEGRALIRGQIRWLHFESRPTLRPNRPPFWSGVVFDVTDRKTAELERAQNHSLLEGTLQATADGILAVSGDGKITSYNRQFVELWRMPREILAASDLVRLEAFVLQLMNQPANFAKRSHPLNDTSKADTFDTLELSDGRILERFSRPQWVADRVVGRVWSFRDVTIRHWAVASLRESEQKFKTLFETANDAILIMNDQVFLDCNHMAEVVYGCEREKIIGESPVHFSPERQADGTPSTDKALEKISAALAGQPQFFEWIHCRADGTPFNAEVSLNRLEVRGQTVLQAIVRDVTARKQAEAARRAAEELYRTLVNTSPDGICVLDVEGRVTFCSPRSLELFRLPGPLLGGPAAEFVIEAEQARAKEVLRNIFQGTSKPHDIFTMRRSDGTQFIAELEGAVLRDGLGVPCGLMVIIRDVTERQRQEEELKHKNQELERFTYTVSHDLKSPLITIKGFAGALLADLETGQTHRLNDDLQRILQAAGKMSDLLNDLLELSRIGRIVNPPKEVSMNRLAQAVVDLLAGSIRQRQARVTVQPDLPAVLGDPQRLQEVVQNLVENSLKFAGETQPPEIEIGAETLAGQTVFFVRDHGRGIEPRYHKTIFGLFNKLDARSEGTGIGLALVERIVENHGGRIWVDSKGLGQGATFYFTLPPHTAHSLPELAT